MTEDYQGLTPPPELVQGWNDQASYYGNTPAVIQAIATQAARWGADQELDACCKWLPKLPPWSADDLRKHRRPKPPSKKQRGLIALQATNLKDNDPLLYQEILNAIEGLPND